MESTKFQITGMQETLAVFEELAKDICDKEARSKVLIPAVKEAMKPVLAAAKGFAPKDTGLLANTLGISGRKPTKRDRQSKYISATDTVIAIVTTKNIPKKLKKRFSETHAGLTGKDLKKAKRAFYQKEGIPYDGRAVANEFGTAKMSPNPFMRIALETQASNVSNILGAILKNKIEQYRSKKLK